MKLAIMQPYFLPYIGYFHLLSSVDKFIIYDNIKYTKKGWINRNRLLRSGKDATFTLPLKKASDHLDIRDRELAESFKREDLLTQFREAYRTAPYFDNVYPMIETIVRNKESNLFDYIYSSVITMCRYLDIQCQITISSDIEIDHGLKGQEKVISLCRVSRAEQYINPMGGIDLYSKETFNDEGIGLKFLQSELLVYPQFGTDFVPWLSVVDVLMFNDLYDVKKYVSSGYKLV